MLTFNFILPFGVPGLPIPRLILVFFLGFFFQSDRPTQYQETHSTLNEKKEGRPKPTLYYFFTILAVACMGPGSCL